MQDEIFLSIVVPAYKEEKRIHKILDAIVEYVGTKSFATETIVVAKGSPDKTAEVARSFSKKIPNLVVLDEGKSIGKGDAVKCGILASRGKYIVFSDADNATPIEQVDKLLKHTDKYQVVIGSRYCADGQLAIPQSLVRRIGSRGLNIIIQLLAIPGIKDTQCGFKLFERQAAKEIFKRQTINNFSFDIEILAIAKKLGFKIKEAGITWFDDPHSTVAPFKDGFKMLGDAWQVRKNMLAGRYK
jgi:dolichyl-phosphate beta-glucosyltransferase